MRSVIRWRTDRRRDVFRPHRRRLVIYVFCSSFPRRQSRLLTSDFDVGVIRSGPSPILVCGTPISRTYAQRGRHSAFSPTRRGADPPLCSFVDSLLVRLGTDVERRNDSPIRPPCPTREEHWCHKTQKNT
ncbi:hypothetical protein AB1N83_007558 [Pleurotus pulmonarius]